MRCLEDQSDIRGGREVLYERGDIPGLGMLNKSEPTDLTVLGLPPRTACPASGLRSGLWLAIYDVADDADLYWWAPITVESGSGPIHICTET
jgi:hypothetical protein